VLALLSAAIGGAFQAWVTRDQGSVTRDVEAGKNQAQLAAENVRANANIELEKEKFGFEKEKETQKQQHELILKMISVGDVKQAKTNLEFLAEAGSISDKALAGGILKAKATPVLPTPTIFSSGSSTISSREVLNCDSVQSDLARHAEINIEDNQLYIESCVLGGGLPGPAFSGLFGTCYVYLVKNKGEKPAVNIAWKDADMSISSLAPGEIFTTSRVVSRRPHIVDTEIAIGKSRAKVQGVLPS
jgi:hypothetical protein